MTKSTGIEKLQQKIRQFTKERKWQKYHTPKNLAMALSVETAELVEIFQWMGTAESREVDAETLSHVEEEIGDIMIYLTQLADQFDINPLFAAEKKMRLNEIKYPSTGKKK